jgi:hypothetical protein
MRTPLLIKKIEQRLNKISSSDYTNIGTVYIIEAYKKAERDWCRRQLHGFNQMREGDEQTKRRIDDLQILLTEKKIKLGQNKKNYRPTTSLPSDYFEYKRLEIDIKKDKCKDCITKVYLIEEANVSEWLNDSTREPSFEWRETFHTIMDNKIKIYHNNKFSVEAANLLYYRQPKGISVAGILDIDGNDNGDVDPEFKDDIVEVLIDETVKILSSDIESWNQNASASRRETENN